jgi:hypothetical protein
MPKGDARIGQTDETHDGCSKSNVRDIEQRNTRHDNQTHREASQCLNQSTQDDNDQKQNCVNLSHQNLDPFLSRPV